MVGDITFHQLDDIGQGFCGVGFNHVVDMVLITLHVSDENVVLVADFLGEAFDIRGDTWGSQEFFCGICRRKSRGTEVDIYGGCCRSMCCLTYYVHLPLKVV